MEIPEIHVLNRFRWQFFGTLTFKSVRISDRRRYHMWYAFLRQAARRLEIGDFQRLLWVLRAELGERTGRFHFHFLLAGLPTCKSSISTCFFLMNLWEEMGGGMARIELFDPRLNAGAYLTKDLARLGNASLSRDFHETGKFSWGDCTLTIANSVPPSPSGLRRGRLEGWKAAANQQRLQDRTHTRR